MSNMHAVAASAVTVTTTSETVIATIGPFSENQAGEFAQGILLEAALNIAIAASSTAITYRFRKNSLTGTLVGVAQTVPVTASANAQHAVMELDPTLVQANTSYVLTAQVTAAGANSTVNRVVLAAQAASAFE